jgi:hypothetical protein
MVKLMLEMNGVQYLPVESVSMQERVRAVEFVLARCGVRDVAVPRAAKARPPTQPPQQRPGVEAWPYSLVGGGDHEA